MTKHGITIEIEEEALDHLAELGDPADVISRLASAAAAGVHRSATPQRDQTDESLRVERAMTDEAVDAKRVSTEKTADDVVRVARARADVLVKENPALAAERSTADVVLAKERGAQRRTTDAFLASEREATDIDLSGERVHVDTLIGDQVEANERMVAETLRAQDLTEEAESARARAEQREQELRAIAEFRELFIGIVGHDLRSPLAAIVTAAALMLRRGNLDPSDAATATRIIRSTQRMTRMIADMLDLTRARLGGGMPISPKPTDLGEVCRNVIEEFDAPIALEIADALTGSWDPDRLAQALSNLVRNAVEYATPGTSATVSAHIEGADVIITVKNEGAPIPPDVLPFIFEPFRRGQQREKSTAGNLGLGLYIARQIAVAHGGTLDVRCAEGRTTFTLRLPRGSEQAVEEPG